MNVANHIAVFGLRHIGARSGTLAGMIEDARIYGRALTAAEIQSLKPNVASDIKPVAWWDFEGDAVKDRAGHFTHHAFVGGAKLKGGRLAIDGTGSLIAARSNADAKQATGHLPQTPPTGPYVPELPRWPDQPPANWLTFHLAHPGPGQAYPGDPNCIFDYKGRVHLHYIYRNPWGFVCGHVSSDDMVRWKWHKTVLAPPTTGLALADGLTPLLHQDLRPESKLLLSLIPGMAKELLAARGVSALATLKAALDQIQIGESLVDHGLTIFPLFWPRPQEPAYALLSRAAGHRVPLSRGGLGGLFPNPFRRGFRSVLIQIKAPEQQRGDNVR